MDSWIQRIGNLPLQIFIFCAAYQNKKHVILKPAVMSESYFFKYTQFFKKLKSHISHIITIRIV